MASITTFAIMLDTLLTLDPLAALSLGALLVYFVFFWVRVRAHPEETFLGEAARARCLWIRKVRDQDQPILAIQTYRNWLLTTNRLAATAILIGGAMLGLAFKGDDYRNQISALGDETEMLWSLRCLLISVNFFLVFANFSLASRSFNHFAILVQLSRDENPAFSDDWVATILNGGHIHYALGLRGYYFAIPLALWFFGTMAMAVGAAAVVFFLYRSDMCILRRDKHRKDHKTT